MDWLIGGRFAQGEAKCLIAQLSDRQLHALAKEALKMLTNEGSGK